EDEVLGSREVLLASLPLRQRLVGNVAEQVLEERVLTLLGRARIRLQSQNFSPHHAGQERLHLLDFETAQRRQRLRGERLAEHGGTPSARMGICSRSVCGNPGTSPTRRSCMARSESGSR